MYEIHPQSKEKLLELQEQHISHTVFTTYPWMLFLEKNQKVEPVVLLLTEGKEPLAYFVGGYKKIWNKNFRESF